MIAFLGGVMSWGMRVLKCPALLAAVLADETES
jgi:hypothetical protein